MLYYTADGRIVITGYSSDEGDLLIPGTNLLWDGTQLWIPTDHLIPVYSISSSLHEKAIVGDMITYNIKLECTNGADKGDPLSVTVPIPSGFSLIDWNSNEGNYDSVSELWTPALEGMEAYLNLILSCDNTGTQSQTVTLNDTGDFLTSECEIQAADSDGGTYCVDILVDDELTIANLQDGQYYTRFISIR